MLRGLDHEGAPGGQTRGELERHQQQRGVPRRDRPDHADRLAARVDEVVGLVGRDDPALDLVGVPGEVAVPGAQPLELADHLPVELAVVADLDPGEAFGVGGDQVGELVHQRGALEAGHRPPLAVQGGAGGGDGVVDVRRPCPPGSPPTAHPRTGRASRTCARRRRRRTCPRCSSGTARSRSGAGHAFLLPCGPLCRGRRPPGRSRHGRGCGPAGCGHGCAGGPGRRRRRGTPRVSAAWCVTSNRVRQSCSLIARRHSAEIPRRR